MDHAHECRVLRGSAIFNLSKTARKELMGAPVMGQILLGDKVAGSFALAINKKHASSATSGVAGCFFCVENWP